MNKKANHKAEQKCQVNQSTVDRQAKQGSWSEAMFCSRMPAGVMESDKKIELQNVVS